MTIGMPSMERLPRMDRLSAQERGITIGDFLVPIRVSDGIGVRVRHLALILAGVVLISLAAQVRFFLPGDPVPVTGQTFAVLLVAGALGVRRGVAATALYLILGAVGLPLFADGRHGITVVLGATGGYLVGFVVASAIVGKLAEFGWDRRFAGAVGMLAIGSIPVYLVGVPWLALTTGRTLSWAVANGFAPFVVGDVLKIALAAVLFPAAWWVVGRRPGDH